MKNLKFISFLMIFVSSFMFVQCTTDPVAGPPGADGIDGIDGVDGVDGVDGSAASCISCHSVTHREPIESAYMMSGHYNEYIMYTGQKLSEYANREDCGQCHTQQGYTDYIASGSPEGFVSPVVSYPEGVSCTACHGEHRSFDFDTDGNDYALRNIDAVTLIIDNTTTLDFGDLSNNCTSCHQPRSSYAIPGPTEDYEITSTRFGPHHGPQSTMLQGIMGANIAGSLAYPAPGESTHVSQASCVSCHMAQSTVEGEGTHTFGPTLVSCTACHTNMTEIPEQIAGFEADMLTLHNLLVAAGSITETGSTVEGTYSAKVAQATWNYKTLAEDNSNGIHNPSYSRALLNNSIEALDN